MYCRKCNNLMNNEEVICSKCGFDNTQDFSYVIEEIKANNSSSEKIKRLKLYLFIIMVMILSSLICLYIFSDIEPNTIKNNNENTQETTIFDNEFIFHGIKVKYPSEAYGTSTNTIFYKSNNNYKIEFKLLDEKEYNKLNSGDLLDSKLGNIITKTGDKKDGYTHLFTLDNQYYLIEVSYDIEESLGNIKRQIELTKIINTLDKNNP